MYGLGEHTLNRPGLLVRYLQCQTGKNDNNNNILPVATYYIMYILLFSACFAVKTEVSRSVDVFSFITFEVSVKYQLSINAHNYNFRMKQRINKTFISKNLSQAPYLTYQIIHAYLLFIYLFIKDFTSNKSHNIIRG